MKCKICLEEINLYENAVKRKRALCRHKNIVVICDDCVKKELKKN